VSGSLQQTDTVTRLTVIVIAVELDCMNIQAAAAVNRMEQSDAPARTTDVLM
jgi:hypothetical protein